MLDHKNVVALKSFFYSSVNEEVYLNLVLEHVPETLGWLISHYSDLKQQVPLVLTKVFTYQLLRAVGYIHCLGIAHRDIKPQNLLINVSTGVLKLCDFGRYQKFNFSSKVLVSGEPNVSYICSRYYRAPELIFGSTSYNSKIDIWSIGCILTELLIGRPIFAGDSAVNQLVEIIKVLGTPQPRQVQAMNSNYRENKFPLIKSQIWDSVLGQSGADASNLVSLLLQYEPMLRPDALDALSRSFFDELRNSICYLPSGKKIPNLFDFLPIGTFFSNLELSAHSEIVKKLLPKYTFEEDSKSK